MKQVYSLFVFALFSIPGFSQISLNLQASKDSYIASGSSGSNYGTSQYLTIQYNTSLWRDLFEFDLSSIPRGSYIVSANLKLYKYNGWAKRNLLIHRNRAAWTESLVNWGNAPALENSDPILVSTGATNFMFLNYDVKSHVEKMTCAAPNFGWTIKFENETTENGKYINFVSKEWGTTSERPLLEIQYYLPLSIGVNVTHCSNATTSNGSATVSVAGGRSPFTYQWLNSGGSVISTTTSASSLSSGLYRVVITDANGTLSRGYVLVGNYESETTVNIQPDGDYGIDAFTNVAGTYAMIHGNNATNTNFKDEAGIATDVRGVIQFNYYGINNETQVTAANLYLDGNAHIGTANASYLQRITEYWCEPCVTGHNHPSYTATDQISIPTNSSSGQDYIINVLPFVNYHRSNPGNSNFGYNLELQSRGGTTSKGLVFYSSDFGTSSARPKLEIKFYCIRNHVKLKPEIDNHYYHALDKKLYVVYDEEYNQVANKKLQYRIYNDLHVRIAEVSATGTATPASAPQPLIVWGTNKLTFDLTNLSLASGMYVLEVINSKNEKQYLRFKVS